MIPKILHHIWPGEDPFKQQFHEWRNTWMKFHPDWTFHFWRLSNLPLDKMDKKIITAIRDPKYSITPKSDLLRFELVRIFGGIYTDTDIECLKPFEQFRSHSLFSGYENDHGTVCPSLFGAEPNNPILIKMCQISINNAINCGYDRTNKYPNKVTSVVPFSDLLKNHLSDNGVKVYPKEVFYPISYNERDRLSEPTPNAFCKHYWYGKEPDGWVNKTVW